ncbi:MAG: HAMP domain-containing histidine kinase, partial [Sandaracinaceae bacterium]|nr:HAMP domain-containing histidine kinase [Sandaracinaceae bacterium]
TVLTLHRNQLKHNVELERDYASPGVIWARHDQLDQVWTNLVHNALQAMDGAGSLRVALRDDGAFLVVEITDSGPGVPEDARERIFDPFYTTKSVGEGSGLGLSICKDIVEGHGGTITLESQPGRTTFAVRLPKQRSSLSPSTRPPAMA